MRIRYYPGQVAQGYELGRLKQTKTTRGALQRPLWRVSLVFCRLVKRWIKWTLMKALLVFWDVKELLFHVKACKQAMSPIQESIRGCTAHSPEGIAVK